MTFLKRSIIGLYMASFSLALGQGAKLTLPQPMIELPIQITNNKVYVEARIDRRAIWLVLDSSVTQTEIDATVAKESGLAVKTAADGSSETSISEIRIGSATFVPGPKVAVLDFHKALTAFEGRPVDGVLGSDFLEQAAVEINYSGRTLRLNEPKAFQYQGQGAKVELTEKDGRFFLKAKATPKDKDAIDGTFMLDTGSRQAIVFNSPLVTSMHLLDAIQGIPLIVDAAIDGEVNQKVGRLDSFGAGALSLDKPIVGLAQDAKGLFASSDYQGVIGGEVLHRYKVTIDPAHNAVYFDTTDLSDRPYEADMSGMTIIASGKRLEDFEVHTILPGGPAEEAGLRIGDVITKIGKRMTKKMTLDEINQTFRSDDYLTLEVQRGKATATIAIRCRRLV